MLYFSPDHSDLRIESYYLLIVRAARKPREFVCIFYAHKYPPLAPRRPYAPFFFKHAVQSTLFSLEREEFFEEIFRKCERILEDDDLFYYTKSAVYVMVL